MSDSYAISDSTEVVKECTEAIQNSQSGFAITQVNVVGCLGLSVETNCTATYTKGITVTNDYNSVLGELIKTMNLISQTLQEADAKMVKANK